MKLDFKQGDGFNGPNGYHYKKIRAIWVANMEQDKKAIENFKAKDTSSWFADLTPYTYHPYEHQAVNVGWLAKRVEFDKEEPTPEFVAKLKYLVDNKLVHFFRGWHSCEFCDETVKDRKLIEYRCGNGSIIVIGKDGTHYAAPKLIHHYVSEHHYKPPQGFVDAVMETV